MVRIICIGNRFYYPDNFGIEIYESLMQNSYEDIEVVEGGVGGMNLALYFEDDAEILLVDLGIDQKKILTQDDIKLMEMNEFDHATALLYLLKTVDKDFTIYLCNEAYKKDEIEKYRDEILELARSLECK
jgi:Ni,Fe-hydrogenase maturation factor